MTRIPLVLLIACSLAVMNAPSAPANDPSFSPHTFDCGADEPPSGPYLDINAMAVFDYDCDAGTLTPVSAVGTNCVHSGTQPITGICAFVTDPDPQDTTLNANYYLAVVGLYANGEGEMHAHTGTMPLIACPNGVGECKPLSAGIHATLTGVSYLNEVDPFTPGCESGDIVAGNHLTVWGQSGTLGQRHDSFGWVCRN